ncbi:hypothetical protein D7Y13_08895 [Corallococcus praedator]|uniref:Phospholipase D-like domain-containing protein n=1 Tax=Corallococcus praedator TaxID=2316724 RepID=A0ABX9QPD0_9BACT|nr:MULTISPECIES: phospholipase D family protein [Corallococcus]RKH32460.1 hypothetical protein D7X75_15590 [Corallococcus sp. CA031C]RKI12648.1 hypothetical protein D7Y13_08895 [Corallococcus praedator]
MKARYLDSRDVETLSEAMVKAAKKSRQLDVAAAFLTKAGAKQVLQLMLNLQGSKRTQQVRVLVGLWLGVTEPEALRQLRRAPGVQLRVAKTPGFHAKHLSFRGTSSVVTFTGSANFTAKGLGGVGELVVEVTDKLQSRTASGERDAFRRAWEDAYPERLTDEVIAAYRAKRKSPQIIFDKASRLGKSLFKEFGQDSNRAPDLVGDGTVLWFPIYGTLSQATVRALEAEGVGRAEEVIGISSKRTFDRIQLGTRHLWVMDLRGRPKDRTLKFQRILREVELATEHDGRYFAIVSSPRRTIRLNMTNRRRLRELGLVNRIDSLSCTERILRAGASSVASALMDMSVAEGR